MPLQIPYDAQRDIINKAREFLTAATYPRVDWSEEHLQKTPERFAAMLWDMTHPPDFEFTTFPNDIGTHEMIVVKDISFYSLCAHHLAPFFGKAHIAYLPDKKIAGLSKIPRTVHNKAAGLQVQEKLTNDIASFIDERLQPIGTAVVLEAEHLCMGMRGVKAPGSTTLTSVMLGAFADHDRLARSEFLSLIGKK